MRRISLEQLQDFTREVVLLVDELSECKQESLLRPSGIIKPRAALVIFLRGELGAGKTTFTQMLARELGVKQALHSPTFSLMKIYPVDFHGFKRFIHIDAYRLNDAGEFSALAPDTFLQDPRAIVCIEWPDRVEEVLPKPDLDITLTHTDSGVFRDVSMIISQ